ncbi:MAG: SAM-dependent methyltransferase [Defluviitaleaceae bacterium]|nr:SAM-dependent methyltransferase [Defluviitaleaceae bacterium]
MIVSSKKAKGRVYTPPYIVSNILDLCDYDGAQILGKHIIDNSCGDGAFLVEIVRRYCQVALSFGMPKPQIAIELGTFIHGIEIDSEECLKCLHNLSKVVDCYGITNVNWDIVCADALTVKSYNGNMDYVVGNPPYVRVHNLNDSYDAVKQFSFAEGGMTDLYIVFYEIGLMMLNQTGVLGYISPSSLFNSLAGATARKHFVSKRSIKKVVDLKHFQPFDAATTYTTIMILTAEENSFVDYFGYDDSNHASYAVSKLTYDDFNINSYFMFGNEDMLMRLKKIASFESANTICVVKNGFATLCDDFFVGNFDFTDHTIPIIKASTGATAQCIYPYDKLGKPIALDDLLENLSIKNRYEQYKQRLKKRSIDKNSPWYVFGRSQGINDVYKQKYAINALIRDASDIKLNPAGAGVGVYSGLYILSDACFEQIKKILLADEFVEYVSMLGKYKSGGYYTYSSKDLSRYLNYKFVETRGDGHE